MRTDIRHFKKADFTVTIYPGGHCYAHRVAQSNHGVKGNWHRAISGRRKSVKKRMNQSLRNRS